MKLSELLVRTELDVLDHLEREVVVPVVDGPQAQGDLIVLPRWLVKEVVVPERPHRPLPRAGVELVRGVAGNNPHTLVADPGTCEWTTTVHDPFGLAIAAFHNTAVAYLIHPEHGATGVAPGDWVVRRQQERGRGRRVLVAD